MSYKVKRKDPATGELRWTGLWRAEVALPDGRRITRTDRLKRVVDTWAAEQETEIRRGRWRDPRDARITLDAWHARWWAARIAGTRTLESNESTWRLHVQPAWGGREIGEIKRLEVAGWAKQMLADLEQREAAAADAAGRDPRPGAGLRTVQQAVGLLSMLLQAALDEDPPMLPGRNPCDGILADLPPPVVRPPVYFTVAELDAILCQLEEPWRLVVDFLAYTGLRWGELPALRLRSFDFLHELVHVYWVRDRKGVEREYPKSKKSRRAVPIPPHLTGHLRDLAAGRGPGDRVFTDDTGGALSYWSFQTAWEKAVTAARTCEPGGRCRDGDGACRDAGHHVPVYSPHVLRHTYASWLVSAGVDLYRVQALLGHESYVTTQRYAHLAPDAHDAVRTVLAGLRPTPVPHTILGEVR
jgi:integrase